jgi:hypothetical protein
LKLHKTLTVTSDAGLCNRLRALLSGKAIAEATGREFAMRWRPTVACGCAFERLFQNDWNVRADIYFDRRNALDLTITPWKSYPEWLSLNDAMLFVHHNGFLIQPARFIRHRPLETRSHELMRELKPVFPLEQRIREYRERFFRVQMIGVHLRRGDLVQLRPDTTGNLETALRRVDERLEQEPDAGILLCTDDGSRNPYSNRALPAEHIHARFQQRYGARVVFTTPSLDRSSPQAIEDALVDLWLLRSTQFFVGTIGSSFSCLAGFGNAIQAVQTAAFTAPYRRKVRWLKPIGLHSLLTRVAHYEYGREASYTQLVRRNLRRLRIFFTGRI